MVDEHIPDEAYANDPYEGLYEQDLYNQPNILMREQGGFTPLPGGINVSDINAVATGMHLVTGDGRADFYDKRAQSVHIPRNESEGKGSRPYFNDGYARLLWDFMQGCIFLGKDSRGKDLLYVRDTDMSGEGRLLKGWHVLDIASEYNIPKAQWNPAWTTQMKFECSKLTLRVLHGIKFNNCVFMREDGEGPVQKYDNTFTKFNWPYELTLDVDFDDRVADEALNLLDFVTANDAGKDKHSHSAENLARFFATPILEPYKHLSYVLYGGGGNGKGLLMGSFERDKSLKEGAAASIDSMKLLGGQRGSGGFSTDQEALKLKTALWAFDEEASDITLEQMTNLKRVSTGDPLTARRIQENAVDVYPKATFAICTNNPVITTMTEASRRRFVFIRMKDGRKPNEFDELRAFREKWGASGFIMASCRMWLEDRYRSEEDGEFWRDVIIGDANDMTPAQEWFSDQIFQHGFAVSGKCPIREDASERKNTIAKLGLRSTTKRLEDDSVVRVLVVADENRFIPYRAAAEKAFKESLRKDEPSEPMPTGYDIYSAETAPMDTPSDPTERELAELGRMFPPGDATPAVAVDDAPADVTVDDMPVKATPEPVTAQPVEPKAKKIRSRKNPPAVNVDKRTPDAHAQPSKPQPQRKPHSMPDFEPLPELEPVMPDEESEPTYCNPDPTPDLEPLPELEPYAPDEDPEPILGPKQENKSRRKKPKNGKTVKR